MTQDTKIAACFVALAIALAACGSSAAPPEASVSAAAAEPGAVEAETAESPADEPETAESETAGPSENETESVESETTEPEATEPEATESESLREGGFGSGSQVSAAGDYADRILDIDGEFEGEWFRTAYVYLAPPDVCGYAEPLAAEGSGRSRSSQAEEQLAGRMSVEVLVYGSPEEAASQVELLNGPNAAACDQVGPVAVPAYGIGDVETGSVAIEWEFGDGIGNQTDIPLAVPGGLAYDSRQYDGIATVGSISENFEVLETWIADGPFLLKLQAIDVDSMSLTGQMASALFSLPAPDIFEVLGLDGDIDALRRATLADDQLPEIYDPEEPASVSRRNRANCYTRFLPEGRLNGPSWTALSPGVGGSRVTQRGSVFISEEAAIAAMDQISDLGLDCYLEAAVQVSPERYGLRDGSFETTTVDGLPMIELWLDYEKFDGFDIEIEAAVIQSGPFIMQVDFFGLPGEAPDLAALARLAIEQLNAE